METKTNAAEQNVMDNFENITKEQFALMVIGTASDADECDDEKKNKLKKFAEMIAERFMEYKQKAVELLKEITAVTEHEDGCSRCCG